MHHKVVLIPGDGIGPEVAQAAQAVLDATGVDIEWFEHQAGLGAIDAGSDTVLPQETMQAIRNHGVALKGPCTTPIGDGFSSVNVALRKGLDLYGAVRPVRNLKGLETRYSDVDIIVVRENTEGLYAGIENVIKEGIVTSIKLVTEEASRRIARFAFEYAIKRKRSKVTVFHKANIMKASDGLFIKCSREEHKDFSDQIEYEEMIIDAACMRIVQDPTLFDVILCENFYGDLISDLAAGFVGGIGVTPGANFGEKCSVFEAVHGSAPDIMGQNKANPLALIMTGVMMLRYLKEKTGDAQCEDAANRVRDSYSACLAAGQKTADLGGNLTTSQFTEAVIDRI